AVQLLRRHPRVVEDEADVAELVERRLGLDEQADEEKRDQDQDQRRQSRQEPLQQWIDGARARRSLVDRATAADRGPGGEASGFHLALRLATTSCRRWPGRCTAARRPS